MLDQLVMDNTNIFLWRYCQRKTLKQQLAVYACMWIRGSGMRCTYNYMDVHALQCV